LKSSWEGRQGITEDGRNSLIRPREGEKRGKGRVTLNNAKEGRAFRTVPAPQEKNGGKGDYVEEEKRRKGTSWLSRKEKSKKILQLPPALGKKKKSQKAMDGRGSYAARIRGEGKKGGRSVIGNLR